MSDGVAQIGKQVRVALESVHWTVRHHEVGNVVSAGDGVGRVRGLPSVRFGELLEHPNGARGLAFDLRPHEIGVLFLDPSDQISAGDELRATGLVASVPVGDELLGRVVGALGRTYDGGPPIRSRTYRPIESEPPGIIDRQPVREPLHTGVKVIDALLPLGRGQRELILGDRATGKTALALDAILAQRGSEVLCVYAAIGLRKTDVTEVVETLRAGGVLEQTVVVMVDADSPPGRQYLAPYSACAIGEQFMWSGRHVLVVYDSLTTHADVYRRISLLLGRPPGREAYPPDVFYLHARLLERATRLHDRLGGGSLTALPIVTTQAGNLAAYIPTNLISITDGQLALDNHLFNEGVRPAVDVGLSVSRVGGKAQPRLLRRLASDLKLLYSQLHELETFARFGAELEPETRRRYERGRRLREALKQPRSRPLRVGHEAAVLFAVGEGYLDRVAVEQVVAFLSALRKQLDLDAEFLDIIEHDDDLTPETRNRLQQAIEAVRRTFPETAPP
jgi:F-type H+/Na+-transporting ATPase subunit alpha